CSAAGLPSGATASFNPASVTTSGTSTMTVTWSTSTPKGVFPLTVRGTSGSLVRDPAATFVQDRNNPPVVDRVISGDRNGTVTTAAFGTSSRHETRIALASAAR